jgi:hypothetical protein
MRDLQKASRILVGKAGVKRLLGRPGYRWVDNIKISRMEWYVLILFDR